MASFSFEDTIDKIRNTPKGKEASMYGPIRDILIHVLGYPASDVDIDTAGEGGRPDVTARALSGLVDPKGVQKKIDWIVVEAKDEVGCFKNTTTREDIFEKKSKYIGTNTSWFMMVEPEIVVVRQVTGKDFSASGDIEILLDGLDKQNFEQRLIAMHYDRAGVPEQLNRFRNGDVSLIATEKLDKPDPETATKRKINRFKVSRKRFFQNVREATAHLQDATRNALDKCWTDIEAYQMCAVQFGKKYDSRNGSWLFNSQNLTIESAPSGLEAAREHDKEALSIRREFKKQPHMVILALEGLPAFQARTGADDKVLKELFAIETANLILARILLLRFFEDHGFFGNIKYVCNGGVEAFQKMRSYFDESYTKLLDEAYRKASRFYAAAFETTELDWVLNSADQGLSNAIEWAMFQLSRYDFTTIKGDILTGIYDRFMDRNQRKKMGEFYTPPSIARYIVKRVGIDSSSRVMDPACGSGTFLIEAYRHMIGDDLDRGAAEYSDAVDVLSRIAGNDLNTFSAVLAQIQLLWQILGMKEEIEKKGFPDIPVTGKSNSLVVPSKLSLLDRFSGELDQPIYDAIIGNPPYIRQERSAQDLDDHTLASFENGSDGFPGVSAKRNAYTLFIYRALRSWCKPLDESGRAGRLGFVVPGGLFDANETRDLRTLFRLGGRWTIREIIDMEVIWKQVFDAKTLPVIIIAENCPATHDDVVSIRLASSSCVKQNQEDSLRDFDLEGLPEQLIPYSDIFTVDGRIMTRLTPDRLGVIRKLWGRDYYLSDAAKTYWVGKNKAAKGKVTDIEPAPLDLHNWTERRMIAGGIAFRNEKAYKANGHTVYKGENIIATEIQGDPVESNVDLMLISDNSLWSASPILPAKGYAIAQVAHCVNAVSFDPANTAFTNTASLFFPREDLLKFPFDLLFLSNIYVFFYGIAARMGTLDTLRSHIYPTNLALMPWHENLSSFAFEIEELREPITTACRNRFKAKEALEKDLKLLGLQSLKKHLQADKLTHITYAECFDNSTHKVTISSPTIEKTEDGYQIRLSEDMFEWIVVSSEDIATGVLMALQQTSGEEMDRSALLNLPIPVGGLEIFGWDEIIKKYAEGQLEVEMNKQIAALDVLVGYGLGLDDADIQFIQSELKTDSFLQGIRPRYPGTSTRKQGFRTGLNSSDRYSS
ncbi:N-6 DNA methylase (plasmid) [Trichlorobacter lovleyi]|uniref:HsdM family class I SAM-dependent methyltransferase n=1 Tax=Trichlorobacter lovleyi TaxID=313985 RepID=UPI002240A97E|nr:N-6 DNA methylase [Trichlorobacter lovleyi]QOX81068.1 N-6 DNA methylase [Trichlorobacter lovleyi]